MAKKNFNMSNLDKVDNMPVGGLKGIMSQKPKTEEPTPPEEKEVVITISEKEKKAGNANTRKETEKITPAIAIDQPKENNAGEQNIPALQPQEQEQVVSPSIKEKSKASGTIRVYNDDIEFLKAYYAHMRMTGNVDFAMIEAVSEAIALLRAKYPRIAY